MREHFEAVKAQIQSDADLADKTLDSALLDKDGKPVRSTYCILFGGGPDDLNDNRLAKGQDVDSDAEYRYTVRSVSTTADGARMVASKAFAALLGKRLTVAGRKCDPIRHTGATEVIPDTSINPPLFYCDDDYVLFSRRG